MGDFSGEWLALREPADHAARSARLAERVADAVRGGDALRILDLGSGTGSNLRYLAPRLRRPQQWLLVDCDAALLAHARARPAEGAEVDTREMDLNRLGDESIRAVFDGRALVTASALLDLVSDTWVATLAGICREAGAAVLFALTYDGRIACAPADAADEAVRALVNEHQRRDKGFGPALGPAATDCAERAFAARGYHVERERSDWILGADARDLQRELIDGWAAAAAEIAPAQSAAIDAWRARRLDHVANGGSRLRVGHEDLAAWMIETQR